MPVPCKIFAKSRASSFPQLYKTIKLVNRREKAIRFSAHILSPADCTEQVRYGIIFTTSAFLRDNTEYWLNHHPQDQYGSIQNIEMSKTPHKIRKEQENKRKRAYKGIINRHSQELHMKRSMSERFKGSGGAVWQSDRSESRTKQRPEQQPVRRI